VKTSIRCAIYTRKSSEEGLEQSFNSLDAQRDACAAYIASQRHEGWIALKHHYDDGGFSGGNMERPGLRQLLGDIEEGKVDLVIVYKVDRLTRSLMDFSKIIERLDKHRVSFVSVTQQFNTTSSMGRLTLNVLLSFAQFEREVTGERIRDKIAASKKKGIFMGGTVPYGYRVQDRRLIVHKEEAKVVVDSFKQYLRLGCVSKLQAYLAAKQKNGNSIDLTSERPVPTGRGALHYLLSNRVYIGKIAHKENVYEGLHQPIISNELWQGAVNLRLENTRRTTKRKVEGRERSPLTGLLFDVEGMPYTPTFANKNGRRYRYYTSQSVIQRKKTTDLSRIPAEQLEKLVEQRVLSWLHSPEELRDVIPATRIGSVTHAVEAKVSTITHNTQTENWTLLRRIISKITVGLSSVEVRIAVSGLLVECLDPANPKRIEGVAVLKKEQKYVNLGIPWTLGRHKGQVKIDSAAAICQADLSVIKALAKSRRWYERIVAGEVSSLEQLAAEYGVTAQYVRRVFRCATIAPKHVEELLNGRSKSLISFEALSRNSRLDSSRIFT
jgi:site-specific DNA recombinase